MVRHGEPGLQLDDLLKILNRVSGLALGQLHPSSEEQPVQIGGVLFEEDAEGLGGVVVLAFGQGDLGDAAPPRQKLGSLLRDFSQELPPVVGLAGPKVKVGQGERRE